MKKKRSRLPPDPERQNSDRADWARRAIHAFIRETGRNELEVVISDFLADLAHLCDREGIDLHERLLAASLHYTAETAGRGGQLVSTELAVG